MRKPILLTILGILSLFSVRAQTPELIVQQDGHLSSVNMVQFSPDERQVLSADELNRLVLWDLNSGKFVRYIQTSSEPELISFSASGEEAIALLREGTLNAWDLKTGKLVWCDTLDIKKDLSNFNPAEFSSYNQPELLLNNMAVSLDRRYLVVSHDHQKISCWDLKLGKLLWSHANGFMDAGNLYFYDQGNIIGVRDQIGNLRKSWLTSTGKAVKNPDPSAVAGIGTHMYLGNKAMIRDTAPNGNIQLVDYQNNLESTLTGLEQRIRELELPVVDFDFSADGKVAALGFGKPTTEVWISPGLPGTRIGRGALLVWDTELDQEMFSRDSLPEILNDIDLSADGRQVLTASSDHTVRLWLVDSGTEKWRMQREASFETSFRFSTDFRRMVMTTANGTVKSWELANREEIKVKESFLDNFSLSADGTQMVSTNRSGELFDWDAMSLEPKGGEGLKDRHYCLEVATALAFSPDGKKVLAGSSKEWRVMYQSIEDVPESEILGFKLNEKGDTIGFIKNDFGPETVAEGVFQQVVTPITIYSNRFIRPFTAGRIKFAPDYFNVSLWDLEKRHSLRVFPIDSTGAWHPIQSVSFSPDGKWATAKVLDKQIAWDIQTGHRLRNKNGDDYFQALEWNIQPPRAASIDKEGQIIRTWELPDGNLRHVITSPSKLIAVALHPDGQHICTMSQEGALVEQVEQSGAVVRKIEAAMPGDRIQYAPDPNFVLVQGKQGAEVFNLRSGKRILQFKNDECTWSTSSNDLFFEGHRAGHVSDLTFLPDKRRVMVAFYGGDLQCWDYKKGDLIFSVFFQGKGDWLVTTPTGLFDASAGALERLYYSVGREIIDLEQIKARYFRPGLLQNLMGFSEVELRDAQQFKDLPLFPQISYSIDGKYLKVQLNAREGGLGMLSLSINGNRVSEDINPDRLSSLTYDLEVHNNFYVSDKVNVLTLRAYNAEGWLKSQAYELNYQPVIARGEGFNTLKPTACGSIKPTLYLLMVGTSKYSDPSKNLTFPDLDASEMAKALQSTGKKLFGDQVQLRLLSTAGDSVTESSKANIAAVFREFKAATPCDVLVVYFSGHGANWGKSADKTNFYYLTKDITTAKLSDPEIRDLYAISDDDLTKWLDSIPAQKKVLILDACNSGKAAENLSGVGQRELNADQVIAIELMKDRTGTFILTGSTADMLSYESSQYGQGLLTYSLLEAISGVKLKDGKFVDIMTLFQHARDRVPTLAKTIKQVQTPVIATPRGGASFPIGIKDSTINIVVAQPKPVIIWSSFLEQKQFKDVLGLGAAMNEYFHQQNAKGAQAKYVYYDIPKYDEGYSIWGIYSLKGNMVTVDGRLFKGEVPIGDAFQVKSEKGTQELVRLILKAVGDRIK